MTPVPIHPPFKGSVENPVKADMPSGQRRYLKLLRTEEGEEIQFEYEDSVLGLDGTILDRFKVRNPAADKDNRNPWAQFVDLFKDEPEVPSYFRIYMDMYHPGILDNEPIPGFTLLAPGESEVRKKSE